MEKEELCIQKGKVKQNGAAAVLLCYVASDNNLKLSFDRFVIRYTRLIRFHVVFLLERANGRQNSFSFKERNHVTWCNYTSSIHIFTSENAKYQTGSENNTELFEYTISS